MPIIRCVFLFVLFASNLSHADSPRWAIDVAGGRDHPLIQRYRDSWMLAYQQLGFGRSTFPGAPGLDAHNDFAQPIAVEGRITRIVYFAPQGKTALEVFRNYTQALQAAGYQASFSCTPADKGCEHERYGLGERYGSMKEADFHANRDRQPEGSALAAQMRGLGGSNMLGTEDLYFTSGTLTANGQTVHVMLNTGKVYQTDFIATYLEIAEPQAMQAGQVTVDASAIGNSLQNSGRVALYGIYFDTGKATLKAESRAQLEQMAKVLSTQPGLKVFIVGHTDDQGPFDANLNLSQQRAQAVTEALIRDYRIDARRLVARGLANLAPVAANTAEDGRARNRRVEMVVQ